jgi:S-formylglutathione hydrolase
MEILSDNKIFSGSLKRVKHISNSTLSDMTFSIFLPPQAEHEAVPVLYWLSGLTCNDENFCHKAGAFKYAAKYGLAIVCPDTSPRNIDIEGQDDSYDFGTGAGFYINATQSPWSKNYNMYTYVTSELPELIESQFNVSEKKSIAGHSMGGHGALMCAFKNPGLYHSISAFAPIVNPSNCPWGIKIFEGYLGGNKDDWLQYDASHLIVLATENLPLLIDQGDKDEFLNSQLHPQALIDAAKKAGYPIKFRMQPGYDHSYYFMASFIESHIKHHAKALF